MSRTAPGNWPIEDAPHWTKVQRCEEPVMPTGLCSLPTGHPLPHMLRCSEGWRVTDAARVPGWGPAEA